MKPQPSETGAQEHAPDAAAIEAYRTALALLHTGQGDARAVIEPVLRAWPGFIAGHCLRAACLVMAWREEFRPHLAATLRIARRNPDRVGERERAHLAAAQAWLDQDLRRALHLYGEIAERDPKDTLALRVAHFGDLQWGRVDQLRDRIAAALPHWRPGEPGYGHVLAMYAFGLSEAGDHALAEAAGREALNAEPHHAGAVHVVAHALEMQGRSADGAAWLNRTLGIWSASPAYAAHLWWHQALFQLDLGELGAALRILDERLMAGADQGSAALVDASALLWRLHLRGVDVAAHWDLVADAWAQRPFDGLRPFNDVHAMLAFVAARRWTHAHRLVDALRKTARRTPDLHRAVHAAALPVCEAFLAFGQGRYARAAQHLHAQRDLSRGCGGSRAQCDLLHLTWLEAALRSRQIDLARSLVAERVASRPLSAYNRGLQARVGNVPASAAPAWAGRAARTSGPAPSQRLAA